MENGALQLQLCPQFIGVAQIAVVSQGQLALLVIDYNGLAVFPAGSAGGAVAHMADGHAPCREPVQPVPGKYLAYGTKIPMGGEYSIVIHHNAAAFLPPVLQREQGVIRQARKILRLL